MKSAMLPVRLMVAATCVLAGCQAPAATTPQPAPATVARQASSVHATGGNRAIALRLPNLADRKVLETVWRKELKNLSHFQVRLEAWDGYVFAEVADVPEQKGHIGSTVAFTHLQPKRYRVIAVGYDYDGQVITDEALLEYDLLTSTGDLDESPVTQVLPMSLLKVPFEGKVPLPQLGSPLMPHWVKTIHVKLEREGKEPIEQEYEASREAMLDHLEAFKDYTVTLTASNGEGLTASDTHSFTMGQAVPNGYQVLTTPATPQPLSADNAVFIEFNLFPHVDVTNREAHHVQPSGGGGVWYIANNKELKYLSGTSTELAPQSFGTFADRIEHDGDKGVWTYFVTQEIARRIERWIPTSSTPVVSIEVGMAEVLEIVDTPTGAWICGRSGVDSNYSIMHVKDDGTINVPLTAHVGWSSIQSDGQGGLLTHRYGNNSVVVERVSPAGNVSHIAFVETSDYGYRGQLAPASNNGAFFRHTSGRLMRLSPGMAAHELEAVAFSMISDGAGGVWVGTQNGLKHYKGDGTVDLYGGGVEYRELSQDPNGGVWASRGAGFIAGTFLDHFTTGTFTRDRTITAGHVGEYFQSGNNIWRRTANTLNLIKF